MCVRSGRIADWLDGLAREGSCYAGTGRVVPECPDLMLARRYDRASRLLRTEVAVRVYFPENIERSLTQLLP